MYFKYNMNFELNINHNELSHKCFICETKTSNYKQHIKSMKHQFNRESLYNKILMVSLNDKMKEIVELKETPRTILKLYLDNEICPICLDNTKETYNGFFECTHSCCEDCFSKIDKCSLCRANTKH